MHPSLPALRAVFDASDEAIVVADAGERILHVNPAFERASGHRAADAVGRTVAELLRPRPVADAPALTIQARAGGEDYVVRRRRIATGDGLVVELQQALDRSEAALRALLDRLPDPVLVHRDGIICYANAEMLRALGYDGVADVIGRSLLDFVHPDEYDAVRDRLRDADREGARSRERRVIARDGAQRTVEVTALPIVFDGAIAHVAICHDVTERKQMAERLADAERMAMLGRLAAAVGHEINNPLTYMLGSLELARGVLAREPTPSPGSAGARGDAAEQRSAASIDRDARLTKYVAAARDGVDRVRDIVRDLRSLSVTAADVVEAVDVERALDIAAATAEHEIRPRARLVRDYGRVPPARSNQGRLTQVFVNLLVNAAHAIPDGDPAGNEIRIATRAEPGRVVIEVRDTGTGISADRLPHIFEPFFTTKPPGAGTGLGLAISRAIVTGHGGTLDAEPLARGAVFRVSLRAAAAAAGAVAASPAAVAVPPPIRILVVDDERLITRVIAELLAPHDVAIAHGGHEAIALLARDAGFDVVVCDLQMSDGTGIAVYDYLRDHAPALARRVIFMTGGGFTPAIQDFLARCPQPVLDKPFDPVQLVRLVAEVAAGSSIA